MLLASLATLLPLALPVQAPPQAAEEAGVAKVHLFDKSGRPLTDGWRVVLTYKHAETSPQIHRQPHQTGLLHTYVLTDLPPGQAALTAEFQGEQALGPLDVRIDPGGEHSFQLFEGSPVAKEELTVILVPPLGRRFSQKHAELWLQGPDGQEYAPVIRKATLPGAITFRGLEPGSYDLHFKDARFAETRFESLQPGAFHCLPLSFGRSVELKAVDPKGAPATITKVELDIGSHAVSTLDLAPGSQPGLTLVSGLPTRRYRLLVHMDGSPMPSIVDASEVGVGRTTELSVIRAAPSKAGAGSFRSDNGRAWDLDWVLATRASRHSEPSGVTSYHEESRSWDEGHATVEQDGTFQLAPGRPGGWLLKARLGEHMWLNRSFLLEAGVAPNVIVDYSGPRSFRGQALINPEDKERLFTLRLTARRSAKADLVAGLVVSPVIDIHPLLEADGSFRVDGIPKGRWTLEALFLARDAKPKDPVEVLDDLELILGDEAVEPIRLDLRRK